jgi:transcriptional regulator with XRE-family HTH domain
MPINPHTLKFLRNKKGLSQDALASLSGVSKKTIARLETAKSKSNANTKRLLARALRVDEAHLERELPDIEEKARELRDLVHQWLGTPVQPQTRLAFQLVEHRYGIPEREQILMAPLFASLLAEASLRWRKDNLDDLEAARARVAAACVGHLSIGPLDVEDPVEELTELEKRSIEGRDIHGLSLQESGITWEGGGTPFFNFLEDFARRSGADLFEFREGPWFGDEDTPEYRIAPDAVEDLTGGNRLAQYALKRGHARLRDIPFELRFDRTRWPEWFASRVPPDERARLEAEEAAEAEGDQLQSDSQVEE